MFYRSDGQLISVTSRYLFPYGKFHPVTQIDSSVSKQFPYFLTLFPPTFKREDPLGMESGAISDSQISASSQWDNNHAAKQGRLNFKPQGRTTGAWSSRKNDLNQWFQVDLGTYTKVTRVATQGRLSRRWPQWVTKYKIQYSVDSVIFQDYREPGNDSAKVF